jgi:hypothetical protein
MLWSPQPSFTRKEQTTISVGVSGGRWGETISLQLPDLGFDPVRIRLGNDESVLLMKADGCFSATLTPGLGKSPHGRIYGRVGAYSRSALVTLRHGTDYGTAIEENGEWKPLDGSGTVEVSVLRTNRLTGKMRSTEGDIREARWVEGTRVLATLGRYGTTVMDCSGLGAPLSLVAGTYNNYEAGLPAASAITDGGFLRDIKHTGDMWSASLPFEESLSEEHKLWAWPSGSALPTRVPADLLEKDGFTLRWRQEFSGNVYGWALSFRGARVGSICCAEQMKDIASHVAGAEWRAAAAWIRWWHCPVLHPLLRRRFETLALTQPVETLVAWLLPAASDFPNTFDELREEAWAAASRELLWNWRPSDEEAVRLMRELGIWSGSVEIDGKGPSLAATGLLARCNPVLLARAATQAAPELYPFPKAQLAVLLRLLLEVINPNALRKDFDLKAVCDRYAQGENRLDGEFIMKSLVGAARKILANQPQDAHNLQIAMHHAGLREIVAIALLRDSIQNWQGVAD